MIYSGKFKVTSPFGKRTLNGVADNHKGIDVVGLDNKNVCAVVGGKVVSSLIITDKSNRTWEWGNYVRIDGDDGKRYYYCHLSKRLVKAGQRVKAGDHIGIEGNTGYSFGSHCHFEVRTSSGVSIDPAPFLGIKNAVGTYNAPKLTAEDYIDKIISKVGFDKPADVKTALLGIKHKCPDELFRKIYEKMK